MKEPFTALISNLGHLAEFGLQEMERQQPGAAKLASQLMQNHRARLQARVEIYPEPCVTLLLRTDEREMMLCQFEPQQFHVYQ